MDDQACSRFLTPDTLVYEVNALTLQSLVDTNWIDSSDNQIILSKFDELSDTLSSLVSDTLMFIRYPEGENISYAVLKVSPAKNIALYTSLKYYYDDSSRTTNINEYVTIELIKRDTTTANSSVDMLPESLTGCTDEVIIAQNERIVPTIRARYIFHLEEGVYLVRFVLSNWLNIASFKTVQERKVRDYYFKVVII
jgi:hypothetical protein